MPTDFDLPVRGSLDLDKTVWIKSQPEDFLIAESSAIKILRHQKKLN